MAILAHAAGGRAGERAVAPFRALATPIADMVRPMPYPEIYLPEEEGYHPVAITRTMFVDAIDRSAADTILEQLQASTAMMPVAQLRALRQGNDGAYVNFLGDEGEARIRAAYPGSTWDRLRRSVG
ncbi:MAG TPA: hypothetical protein VGL18_16580 [Actinomycetota bacterium]|jgi:hypothetical protein